METRNVSGDVLSNEVFEEKEDLVDAFNDAMDDVEVKTIKVTKDVVSDDLTDQRKKFLHKKIRKLERKHAVYRQELRS
jgi:hypothetical protein